MKHTIIALSDMHVGSAFGIFPQDFVLSVGSVATLNVGQEYLLECWNDMLTRIPKRFDVLVLNGDIVDGQQPKQMARELTEPDPAFQVRAAIQLLQPLAKRAKKVFVTRGTSYHVGQGHEFEEHLAELLKAERQGNSYTRDWLLLDVGGARMDFAHHTSHMIRYRTSALSREIQFSFLLNAWKDCDLIVRSHIHHYIQVNTEGKIAITTPGWQLQPGYAKRSKYPHRMFPKYLGAVQISVWPDRKQGARQHSEEFIATNGILYEHPELGYERGLP